MVIREEGDVYKRPPSNMRTTLLVLCIMGKVDRCTLAKVAEFLGISKLTFHRAITTAKSVFGVDVEYVRFSKSSHENLPRGCSGYYHVTNWGCLNKDQLIEHVEKLIELNLM